MPAAGDIDYADTEAVGGYGLLLCKAFEQCGGLSYPSVMNRDLHIMISEGRIWLREVKSLIGAILSTPADIRRARPGLSAIPALLDVYDLVHRLCEGVPCKDFIRQSRIKTAELWLKGDNTIGRTDVVIMLLDAAGRDSRSLDRRYVDFSLSVMGEWIERLNLYGRFRDCSFDEACRRLTCLVGNDLSAFTGVSEQMRCKARWVKACTRSDITALDTKTLRSYIALQQSAVQHGLCQSEIDEASLLKLLAEYSTRPDLHPLTLKALSISPQPRA